MKNKLFFTIFIVLVLLMLKIGITANCNSLILSAITYFIVNSTRLKKTNLFLNGFF
jgi:hypothetical protein